MTQPAQPPRMQGAANHLSEPRLSPYLEITGGHKARALKLYRWNVKLSAALYEVLHFAEVALRNTLDGQLRTLHSAQGRSSEWLTDPLDVVVRVVGQRHLDDARSKANKATRGRANHDDMVAALSLGTWVTLLPGSGRDAGKAYLWHSALRDAFVVDTDPAALTRAAHSMLHLRNRVAHLEPVLDRGRLNTQYAATRHVLTAIDPQLLAWVMSDQTVDAVMRRRPH